MLITNKHTIPEDHKSKFADTVEPELILIPACGSYYTLDRENRHLWYVPQNREGLPKWDDANHPGIAEYLVENIKFDDDFLQTINQYYNYDFCHCDFQGHDCLKHNVPDTGPSFWIYEPIE